jgi:hypothetical protein
VATGTTLQPRKRSGAAHSSSHRCEVAAQITDWYESTSARSARTLAPVPVSTNSGWAASPNASRSAPIAAAVCSSWP